jgi:hypothetical protein
MRSSFSQLLRQIFSILTVTVCVIYSIYMYMSRPFTKFISVRNCDGVCNYETHTGAIACSYSCASGLVNMDTFLAWFVGGVM